MTSDGQSIGGCYYLDILGEDLIEVCASIILSRASQPVVPSSAHFVPNVVVVLVIFFSVLRKFCDDGGDIVRSNVIRLRPNLQPPSPPKGEKEGERPLRLLLVSGGSGIN